MPPLFAVLFSLTLSLLPLVASADPPDVKTLMNQVQEVFDTGKVVVTERYHPKAGHVEIHSFPIFDEIGAVVMAGEYHRNINARRQAEDALREKNQVLEEIINASPLAIIARSLRPPVLFGGIGCRHMPHSRILRVKAKAPSKTRILASEALR
jgi:PAS domain-containing protein